MPRAFLRATPLILLAMAACADLPTAVLPDGATRADHASAAASITVVMSNLDSPRGLEFGPDGALYVVESGAAAVNGPCVTIERGQNCWSGTGAVSRLRNGQQQRIVSGLPSVVNPDFGEVTGPHDLSFRNDGAMFITIGWGADPALRAELGSVGSLLGTLLVVQPLGRGRVVADIAGFEQAFNPDGGHPDSNPYGVQAAFGRQFVTDAGGNSLVETRGTGQVSLVATFSPIPVPPGPFNPPFAFAEAVPTQVKVGPDRALYVSTLTGVPFHPGLAGIYRVVPGQAPVLWAGGYTAIIDFDWGPDGSLYVLQFATAPFLGGPGALIRQAPDGTRTTITTALVAPTGITVGPDGALYVSNFGPAPAIGEVLRIVP
jgi:hypothetical protein